MTVTQADVQAFANQIQALFVPWQGGQVAPTVGGRPDESGNTVFIFEITLAGVPYPVATSVGESDVVLIGPATFTSRNPTTVGWVPKPSEDLPESFEVHVPDPAGTDGDFVNLTITTDVPQVIQGAVSTLRAIRSV